MSYFGVVRPLILHVRFLALLPYGQLLQEAAFLKI